jgi:rfaE bifunctional protein nucleotidyltransferase chain/domain
MSYAQTLPGAPDEKSPLTTSIRSVILHAANDGRLRQGSKRKQHMPNSRTSKVLTLRAAASWAAAAHRRKLRVVATNGCFDLLHFGHVTYLQRARAMGDLLVVGLNSDKSVRALKGSRRPLVPERERAGVLAALACVDAVVIFSQKRADRFLRAVRPDIYVKGGDYRPETLDSRERGVLTALGTRVRIIPFVKGCSTTGLIRRIAELTW